MNFSSSSDLLTAVRRPCHNSRNVEMENGSRQFGHTVSNSVGRSVRFNVFSIGVSFHPKRRLRIWGTHSRVIHESEGFVIIVIVSFYQQRVGLNTYS